MDGGEERMTLNSKKMNLDYIRTFTVLGQSRNMTEASRKLGVDTSYVSRHIKQLEEELQTKLVLLDSKNKEMKLTESGQYFFEKYEKIYNEILLAEKNYDQENNFSNIKITIGVSNELENYFFKNNLQEFAENYPTINFKIKNNNFEALFNSLLQYSTDFILCKRRQDFTKIPESVAIHSLFQSNYCFVYHPLKYHYSDISEASVIIPMNETDERQVFNQYLEDHDFIYRRSYEVETFDQMLNYVQDGLGVGFMLKEVALAFPELKVIELDCPCEVILAYESSSVSPIVQEFINMYLKK